MQTQGQAGYRAPQDPSTMPRSEAPFSEPRGAIAARRATTLEATGDNGWTSLGAGTAAPEVKADGDGLRGRASTEGLDAGDGARHRA